MNQRVFQAIQWLRYWLIQVDKHSLQPPTIFQFFNEVINQKPAPIQSIEEIRKELLKNEELILIQDFGAGSVLNKNTNRSIKYIARTSSSSVKFSCFLKRAAQYIDAKNILELGTSFGLNTSYLANKKDAQVTTIEGSLEIAEVALENFQKLDFNNIKLVQANIDNVLTEVLSELGPLDLIYMDANHTYGATISYFNQIQPLLTDSSIVIIDDIHWSEGMYKAWKELCSRKEVSLSIDIFDAGLLFFKSGLTKSHYTIKF